MIFKLKLMLRLPLLAVLAANIPAHAINTMLGVIKFPEGVPPTTPLRIYYAGRILPAEIETASNEVLFSFPCTTTQRSFFLIVTDQLQPVSDGINNTIQYLKIAKNASYKAFQLHITPAQENEGAQWQIQEFQLPADNRLPDSALIVFFDPQTLDRLEGGSEFSLPTIKLTKNTHRKSGDEFKELCTKLLLSSLDVDTIHTVSTNHVKHIEHKGKTLIIPIT